MVWVFRSSHTVVTSWRQVSVSERSIFSNSLIAFFTLAWSSLRSSMAFAFLLRVFVMAGVLCDVGTRPRATAVPSAVRRSPGCNGLPDRKDLLPAHEARPAVDELQGAAGGIPAGQHPALAATCLHIEAVCARPVGVPVDQARDEVALKRLAHRRIVDVHDFGGFRRNRFLALLAQSAHRRAALGERLGEELPLPVRRARRAPPRLIVMVIGAEGVAVHQQDTIGYRGIGK